MSRAKVSALGFLLALLPLVLGSAFAAERVYLNEICSVGTPPTSWTGQWTYADGSSFTAVGPSISTSYDEEPYGPYQRLFRAVHLFGSNKALVAGDFKVSTSTGDATFLAIFDFSTNTFSPVPLAMQPDGEVFTIRMINSKFYFSGEFSHSGSVPCMGVFSTNPDLSNPTCEAVVSIFPGGGPHGIYAISNSPATQTMGPNLVFGGRFPQIGLPSQTFQNVFNLALFDLNGRTFSQINDTNMLATDVVVYAWEDGFNGLFYAYSRNSGTETYLVYKHLETSATCPLGVARLSTTTIGLVQSIFVVNNGAENEILVVGGRFDSIGTVTTNVHGFAYLHTRIARNCQSPQTAWTGVSNTVQGHVLSLFVGPESGLLYVAGHLETVTPPTKMVTYFTIDLNADTPTPTLYSDDNLDPTCQSEGILVVVAPPPPPPSPSSDVDSSTVNAAVGAVMCTIGVVVTVFFGYFWAWRREGLTNYSQM